MDKTEIDFRMRFATTILEAVTLSDHLVNTLKAYLDDHGDKLRTSNQSVLSAAALMAPALSMYEEVLTPEERDICNLLINLILAAHGKKPIATTKGELGEFESELLSSIENIKKETSNGEEE